MSAFLILCCLKLISVDLISGGYLSLEIIQVTLKLVVKRAGELNLVIVHD